MKRTNTYRHLTLDVILGKKPILFYNRLISLYKFMGLCRAFGIVSVKKRGSGLFEAGDVSGTISYNNLFCYFQWEPAKDYEAEIADIAAQIAFEDVS